EEVSGRADLYAWALVFVECLVGAAPMLGRSAGATIQNQLSPEPVPIPEQLRTHPLGALLTWALDKRAARRPAKAEQLLERLVQLDPIDLGRLADRSGYLRGRSERSSEFDQTMVTEIGGQIEGERRQVVAVCCRAWPLARVAATIRATTAEFGASVAGAL